MQVVAGSTHRGVGVVGGHEMARVGRVFSYRREVGHPVEQPAVADKLVDRPPAGIRLWRTVQAESRSPGGRQGSPDDLDAPSVDPPDDLPHALNDLSSRG